MRFFVSSMMLAAAVALLAPAPACSETPPNAFLSSPPREAKHLDFETDP
jgi:hypothetical protein